MRSVFLDYSSVSYNADLDPAQLLSVLPGLEFHAETTPSELIDRLRGCEMAIFNKGPLTRDALMACPELRLVALTGTGTNHIDLAAAREQNVAICNIRDYCTQSVVQHVFAVLLCLTHRLREFDRLLKAGAWELENRQLRSAGLFIRELSGKTLGIVGYGVLGKAVGVMAEAFGMHVLVANSTPRQLANRVALDELLPRLDVLSLHCPLTPETHHLIGTKQLQLMKRDAILINTARGGLVDCQALTDALRNGQLGGAACDVLPEEPPLSGNPLLAPDLAQLIVTPHTAWAAREARQRSIDEVALNIKDFLLGGQRNRVV